MECVLVENMFIRNYSGSHSDDRMYNNGIVLFVQEIVAALQEQCNIIPIMDNFSWPEPETMPEDMRNVSKFNGVRWIHDYQDACVEKVERFMRGEMNGIRDGASSGLSLNRSGGPSTIRSDASAPNTPLTIGRSPPTYQRTQSNDSERDLNGSKD